jgi:hypothetical protein
VDRKQFIAELKAKVAAGTITSAQANETLRLWDNQQKVSGVVVTPETMPLSLNETVDRMIQYPTKPVLLQPESASRDRLELADTDIARAELERRAEIEGMSFFEALTSPDALERIGKAALKGPSQIANTVTAALPGLALQGIKAVTGDEISGLASDNAMANYADMNQRINDNFGSSDAITPLETGAGLLTSALVPGGPVAKAASVMTDLTVDQTIREITDTDTTTDDYNTMFDRAGLGFGFDDVMNNVPAIVAAPLVAIGAYSLLKGNAVNAMKSKVLFKPPTAAQIYDFDRFAPPDLMTIETSADARKAYIVDQQTALTNVVTRAGVPDPKLIEDTVTLNTHSAGNTRAREALSSGFLDVDGQQYSVGTSVRTLYDAAMKLPLEARQAVERYIVLHDMLDDARIQLSRAGKPNQLPGNHLQTVQQRTAEIHRIRNQYPIVDQFHSRFKEATAAVRGFLDGDILDPTDRIWLDANRPNYAPAIFNETDHSRPFIERLIQTQHDGEMDPEDWFLMQRESAGNYDPATRGSPFEGLFSMTEASLRLGMKNNTRMKIVDALLQSNVNNALRATDRNLIRKIRTEETIKEELKQATLRGIPLSSVNTTPDNLAGNVDRLVKVRRGGKTEVYITSQLTAEMLKLDPYIAKMPLLFVPKRIAEWSMVGPGSLVFAPVTALRDTIGGFVMRPDGVKVGNPLQVAAAVPKQLWAKAQGALADNIKAGLVAGEPFIPTALMNEQAQAQFATTLSNRYLNTLYHQANNSGGFDASIMKSSIVTAQDMLGEIQRTIRDGSITNNPVMTNIVTRFGISGARTIVNGFTELFNSISDAPRFAAFEKTVKSGKSVEEAATLARNITGDTGRTGRVYRPDGRRMGYDAVDRGVGNLVTPALGHVTNVVREGVTFVNPMIQGTRRVINSFKDDPAGTMMRTWLAVGLPSLAAYGWNEMLGEEYNDYAMDRRSSTDVAGKLYIGNPMAPPEQGIEIPMPQELQLFMSPYSRSLHAWTRGEEKDSMSAAMQTLAASIFGNTLSLSSFVTLDLAANAAGYSPDGFLGVGGGYQIREDNTGFLPQNVEMMARTMFSNVGNLAIQIMYSMSGEDDKYGDFNNFITTVVDDVGKRTPIVNNMTGRKSANVTFSIPAEYDKAKSRAMTEFIPYWRTFFDEKYRNEDDLNKPGSLDGYISDKGPAGTKKKPNNNPNLMDGREDLPFLMVGPNGEKPTNPLFMPFGAMLKRYVDENAIGIGGLDDRDKKYSMYVKQLRGYNAGDRGAIAEWQASLEEIADPQSEDTIKLQDMIERYSLNLESYQDRIKMINLIENERSFVIQQKLEAISAIEEQVTTELRNKGLLGANDNFRIDKHMKPFDNAPLGITQEMLDMSALQDQ